MPALSRTRLRTLRAAACAAFLAGLGVALGACATSASSPDGGVGGNVGQGGTFAQGGLGGAVPSATLSLEAVSTEDGSAVDATRLKPLQQVNIVATSRPPAERTIRFALLGVDGETPLDAVLEASEVLSDAVTGQAAVRLTAARMPTHFQVRASAVDATPAALDVVVMKNGKATLLITPRFDSPRKSPSPVQKTDKPSYTASAWPDQTCTGLKGSPPPDGSPLANSVSFPLELEVPSDTQLAVLVRIEEYAWGCTAISAAKEGPPTPVEVLLTNVPIKLDGSQVELTLELDAGSEPLFDAALAEYQKGIVRSFETDASDDVEALLNAMQEAAQPDSAGFEATRQAEKWDSSVRTALGAGAATALRAPLDEWLGRGLAWTHDAPALVVELEGMADAPPLITLKSVFGLEPWRPHAVIEGEPSLTVDGADGVLLGTRMAFDPRALLLSAARVPAMDDVASVSTLAQALSAKVCETVAATLDAHGCDDSCAVDDCTAAVGALVDASGSGERTANIDIALTALATVGNDAELTGLSGGTWLGSISMTDEPDVPPTNVTGSTAPPMTD